MFNWVTTYSGTSTDIGRNIICDNQKVYLVGNASSPVDFNPSTNVQGIPFYGLTDAFITKLSDCLPSDSSLFAIACNLYHSPSGTYRWTTAGTYTDSLINQNGCDSILTINLFITNQNKGISQNGFTLSSNASNSTYQWLDCNNGNAPIVGETNASYTATQYGDYAVELTQNGCKDTSTCVLILGVGIESIDFLKEGILISPNPSNGQFNVRLMKSFNGALEIYNNIGQSVYREVVVNSDKISVTLNASEGVYLLRLTGINGVTSTSKVILK